VSDRDSTPKPDEGGFADEVMNVVVPGYDKKVDTILSDMDAEAAADKKMLATEEALIANRPSAEADGVDISAITAADPTFADQGFLTIARETFDRVREARGVDNPRFADAQLSPQLTTELKQVIQCDHHLLPGLEIQSALITSTNVAEGKLTIVVRFHLWSEEIDRDDEGHVVAGDTSAREWDEDWTFWRDPSDDSAAVDQALTDEPIDAGGWMVAHQGWIVTAIDRVGAPDPLDPTNL
jgi:predicted lipid-binding transport protein (Tim44 family)